MSHQNLKRISGIHIDHKRNKIHKNEGFLKKNHYAILPDSYKKWLLSWSVKFFSHSSDSLLF